jgi:hypothetical protein
VTDVVRVVGYDTAADRFTLDTPALVAVPHGGTAA